MGYKIDDVIINIFCVLADNHHASYVASFSYR